MGREKGLQMITPEKVAEKFINRSESIHAVEMYGQGIIHDTFLVRLKNREKCFILQRLNRNVFTQPELIMHNLRHVCNHINSVEKSVLKGIDSSWKMLDIIPTTDNRDFFVDSEGGFWRALSFIYGARPLEKITKLDNVREAGRALGFFHQLTENFDPDLLYDTLPGFHNIGHYLSHYDQVLFPEESRQYNEHGKFCEKFIDKRRGWSTVLEHGRKLNKLRVRIIHGDPKINNIMLDEHTGRAVSIIDLDTVRPGLLLYDLGDCMRSCCNISGETQEDDHEAVQFDLKRCEALLAGYMEAAHGCFSGQDYNFAYDAIRLIPFELGLRFFTDYLEGNLYFKINQPAQNLIRAVVQFTLVESIEQQEETIRALFEKYRLT